MLLNTSISIVLNTCKLPFVQFLPFLFVQNLHRMLLNHVWIIDIFSEILQSSILFVNYLIEHIWSTVSPSLSVWSFEDSKLEEQNTGIQVTFKAHRKSKFHKVILRIASPLFRNIFPATTDIQIYHMHNQNNFLIISLLLIFSLSLSYIVN